MTPYLVGLAINTAIGLLAAFLFVWHYYRTVALPQRVRALQYKIFALRDRAVRLVAEGVMAEDDPGFQILYSLLNHSAKAAEIGRARSGLSFVLHLLKLAKPPALEQIKVLKSLPGPAGQLLAEFTVTILFIFLEGSITVRLLLFLALNFSIVKEWIKRSRPEEVKQYEEWQRFANTCTVA